MASGRDGTNEPGAGVAAPELGASPAGIGLQRPGRLNRACVPCLAKDLRALGRSAAKVPVLSYFTGAGLLDLGFAKFKFDVVWRNENNPHFIRGFQYAMSARRGGGHLITNQGSIDDIGPRAVLRQAFGGSGRPDTFGIIGGPPCPDFSRMGKHLGEHGDHGKLSNDYVDHILAIRPSFFLLENVPGLFRVKKIFRFYKRLAARLRERYYVDDVILNALDFGVPQNRERVFAVGFRKDWLRKRIDVSGIDGAGGWFPWPINDDYDGAKQKYDWPGRAPFGGAPVKPEGIPACLMTGTHICREDEDLALLPNGEDKFNARSDKFTRIEEGDDTRKSFKRLHRWRYSPTAAYGNNEVHLHPKEARRLSVREVMRLQTVPDWYALPADMPLSHKFKMIGNGVPTGLAEAVAGSIFRVLNGKWSGIPQACCRTPKQ